MNDQNLSNNLRFTRRRLKLSQKQFINSFLSDDNGEALLSVPKLSNLENRGGNGLEEVCTTVAQRLGLSEDDFKLDQTDYTLQLEKVLGNSEITEDKELDDIVQEADRHSQLVAFIRTLSNYLTDMLISDQLLPGDKIPSERALSKKFGVSRSIARETLKVLNVLGMIDIIPGKGTFIANSSSDFFITPISWAIYLTDKNADDVFFVRRSIEESTIGLSCERAEKKDVERMEDILRQSRSACDHDDYDLFSELDIEFHMAIASCSHNEVAVNLLLVLRKLSRSISQKGMVNRQQLESIYKEHMELLDAIRSSDPERARRSLKQHFDNTQNRYSSNAGADIRTVINA